MGPLEYVINRLYCICNSIYTSMFNENIYRGIAYSGKLEKDRYAPSFYDQILLGSVEASALDRAPFIESPVS